jgi:hypothetical protein
LNIWILLDEEKNLVGQRLRKPYPLRTKYLYDQKMYSSRAYTDCLVAYVMILTRDIGQLWGKFCALQQYNLHANYNFYLHQVSNCVQTVTYVGMSITNVAPVNGWRDNHVLICYMNIYCILYTKYTNELQPEDLLVEVSCLWVPAIKSVFVSFISLLYLLWLKQFLFWPCSRHLALLFVSSVLLNYFHGDAYCWC